MSCFSDMLSLRCLGDIQVDFPIKQLEMHVWSAGKIWTVGISRFAFISILQ